MAAILADPAAAAALRPLEDKGAPAAASLADAVDGRLFHVVLAVLVADGAEGLALAPLASRPLYFARVPRPPHAGRMVRISVALRRDQSRASMDCSGGELQLRRPAIAREESRGSLLGVWVGANLLLARDSDVPYLS